MKFDNWFEYVLLGEHNEFLGQGSSATAAVRNALNRGITAECVNRGMVHRTALRPYVDVKISLRTSNGMLREIGK